MKMYERAILLLSSVILAIIQSFSIEGTFQYFGYIMFAICVLVAIGSGTE